MSLIYWYIKGLLGLVGLGLAITAIATVNQPEGVADDAAP